MNTEHRYILEPYKGMSSRYRCPSCEHRDKTFSRYIDTVTNEQLGDRVGRCERVDSCGYHFTPKQYFIDNGIDFNPDDYTAPKPIAKPKTSYFNPAIFKQSLVGYNGNHFITYLKTLFDIDTVNSLIGDYFIGTSSHWKGSTVFWQIDQNGLIRTGKVMLYDPVKGKRVKQPFNHITWAHKLLNIEDFNLSQCLFGEHLLKLNDKPVAVVESEKTAIIASVYMPKFNWLACGSLQNLTEERCKCLIGRKTILYPDLKAFDKWKIKADALGFGISSILETAATDEQRDQGLDLADFLILTPVKKHLENISELIADNSTSQNKSIATTSPFNRPGSAPADWDLSFIDDLVTMDISGPIKINNGEVVSNPKQFISSHVEVIKANNGNKAYLPYYNRLKSFHNQIQQN